MSEPSPQSLVPSPQSPVPSFIILRRQTHE